MSIYDAIANPMVPNIAQAVMQGQQTRLQQDQATQSREQWELQSQLMGQQIKQNQGALEEQEAEQYINQLDRAYRTAQSAANLYNRILPTITDEDTYRENLQTLRLIDKNAPETFAEATSSGYLEQRGAVANQSIRYSGELGELVENLALARRQNDPEAAALFSAQMQALSTPTPEGDWRMNNVFEGADGAPVISMSTKRGDMIVYDPNQQNWVSMGPTATGVAPAGGRPTRTAVAQLRQSIDVGELPPMTQEQFAALPREVQERAAVNDLMVASEELMAPEDRAYIENLRGRTSAERIADEERARLEVRREDTLRDDIVDARAATNQAMMFARTQIETLDGLLYDPETRGSRINFYTTGLIGSVLGTVPGFSPYDVQQQLAAVRSAKGFQQLMEIKKSGAGLGHVPQVQLESLQNSIISLNESQSPRQLEENIRRYRNELRELQNVLQDSFRETYGESWDSYRGERDGVRRYNPATGRIE